MRTGLLALALLCVTLFAGGCFTVRLVKVKTLPPESYGEFLGVERLGPGEDLFIYRLERHTGSGGYHYVRPSEDDGPPETGVLDDGASIAREALYAVPIIHGADRRALAAPPRAAADHPPDQPHYRLVWLGDALGREHHRYERWSEDEQLWIRLGSCRMGTRKYRVRPPAWTLIFLPFTLVLDAVTLPIQLVVLIIRGMVRDIIRHGPEMAADAARAAVIGAAVRRVR
jgi:uncharacterized protein YceK